MRKIYIKCKVDGIEQFEFTNNELQRMLNDGKTCNFTVILGGSKLELELVKK